MKTESVSNIESVGLSEVMFSVLSFTFSIDRKRNPEPWESVDPTVPQKVLLDAN